MRIGYIGLGLMGRPMAEHLQRARHELFIVQHKTPLPDDLIAAGAIICQTTKAVAEAADLIIINVPDTPDVEAVIFSEDGVAAGLSADKIVMDMSTISPTETRHFARKINALKCHYVDAPVSGGDIGARNATLTIMVGADSAVFERVLPILSILGKTITLIGDNGAGQTCKACNQIIVALNVEAVAEGLLFAAKSGVDPAKVREALMGGFASSRALEIHGERMIKRTFEPGFRVELHAKDLNIALQSARSMGLSLPNTATAQELFNACAANGWGKEDDSAIVKALELLAGTTVGTKS